MNDVDAADGSVDRGAYVIVLVLVAITASFAGFVIGFISGVGVRLP